MNLFSTLPVELLENIAFFTGTHTVQGPPKGVVPLLTTNKSTYSVLAFQANPHLYARIYAYKFDTRVAIDRFKLERTSAVAFATELKRRFVDLTRLRGRFDCLTEYGVRDDALLGTLWTAYCMMLENEGRNERQLREYVGIADWLRDYWFHPRGASLAAIRMDAGAWTADNEQNALAMWLFWILLKLEDYDPGMIIHHNYRKVIKAMALGAHRYRLSSLPWYKFNTECSPNGCVFNGYDQVHRLVIPPLAVPAILSFFTLEARRTQRSNGGLTGHTTPLAPSSSGIKSPHGLEWAREWERCKNIGQAVVPTTLSSAYRAGSVEGVWEGTFTYTEFNVFASLLHGAGPATLEEDHIAHHRQTWKLREHYLYADEGSEPLSGGHSMVAYFPVGASVQKEESGGITVGEPGRSQPVRYTRRDHTKAAAERKIVDVVITGEGHSAWGEFMVMGRVRPRDGLMIVHKTYTSGQRGTWIYRGYLVGNVNANLAGRWRDTMTAEKDQGYEGPFAMSRRR